MKTFKVFSLFLNIWVIVTSSQWTATSYPDIRGPSVKKCGNPIPSTAGLLYICDPDHMVNNTQLSQLNTGLEKLAVGTPCICTRRFQCASGDEKGSAFHGFVVSVALLTDIEMKIHSPSEEQLTDKAEAFCRTLEGRWALGDCGNSVIVLVWKHYKKVIIWPARLAERYITHEERKNLLASVNHHIQNDEYYEALNKITHELHLELTGNPESRLDLGILSLLVAVSFALFASVIVSCCVCAFRCCGTTVPTDDDSKSLSNVSSFRAQGVIRRFSQLRRSPRFIRPPENKRLVTQSADEIST